MGELALTATRTALESGPSLEAKQRLERMIAHALSLTPSGEQLGQLGRSRPLSTPARRHAAGVWNPWRRASRRPG